MAETKRKGDLAEVAIMADILKRGYKIAIPYGEDWRYDLIVERNGNLERVQCKYTASDGNIVQASCRCSNNWLTTTYTQDTIDWLVVYDKTTDKCFYIPSNMLGNGRNLIHLRLTPTKSNQTKKINWAKDFLKF